MYIKPNKISVSCSKMKWFAVKDFNVGVVKDSISKYQCTIIGIALRVLQFFVVSFHLSSNLPSYASFFIVSFVSKVQRGYHVRKVSTMCTHASSFNHTLRDGGRTKNEVKKIEIFNSRVSLTHESTCCAKDFENLLKSNKNSQKKIKRIS